MICIIDYAAAVRERLSDNGLITAQTRLMCGFRKWLDYTHLLEQNRKLLQKYLWFDPAENQKCFSLNIQTKTSQTQSLKNS